MTATSPLDRQDERLASSSGLLGTLRATAGRVRDGDLGLLPVVAGLVVIWTIFQLLNPVFLSPRNLSDLLMQSAPVGVIALGIVFVLLIGEIDLSVGSVSGLSAAILAVLAVNRGVPLPLAMLAAVAVGALIGLAYGVVFTRIGVPSFVISLAGLLGFLGLQLWVLGPDGTINIPFDSPLVQLGQLLYVPDWLAYVLAAVAVAAFVAQRLLLSRRRRAAGLSAPALSVILVQAGVLAAVLLAAAAYLYAANGVGWMFVIFVVLVLVAHYAITRTGWGRAVMAVGGNREAARRSGIRVRTVSTSAFVVCTTLAAAGGLLAAGRLSSAAQSSGGGDVNLNAIAAAVIGGTSLFGGRGSAFSALLGILVISSISSGLTLLNLDSSIRYMVTGAVVLIAVALDAVARRSRTSHGRA
jgi:D-xylose transport system permease protein